MPQSKRPGRGSGESPTSPPPENDSSARVEHSRKLQSDEMHRAQGEERIERPSARGEKVKRHS